MAVFSWNQEYHHGRFAPISNSTTYRVISVIFVLIFLRYKHTRMDLVINCVHTFPIQSNVNAPLNATADCIALQMNVYFILIFVSYEFDFKCALFFFVLSRRRSTPVIHWAYYIHMHTLSFPLNVVTFCIGSLIFRSALSLLCWLISDINCVRANFFTHFFFFFSMHSSHSNAISGRFHSNSVEIKCLQTTKKTTR